MNAMYKNLIACINDCKDLTEFFSCFIGTLQDCMLNQLLSVKYQKCKSIFTKFIVFRNWGILKKQFEMGPHLKPIEFFQRSCPDSSQLD